MNICFEKKDHLPVLAKIFEWAISNEITVSCSTYKVDGSAPQISLRFTKNGKSELIRIFDWTELTRPIIQKMVMDQAFNLCLTRLEL